MKNDPVRLRDDPRCPAELRADLGAESAAMLALGFDAAAGALRLRTAVQQGARLSSVGQLVAASGPSSAGAWLSLKWVAVVVGGLGVAGLVTVGLWHGSTAGTVSGEGRAATAVASAPTPAPVSVAPPAASVASLPEPPAVAEPPAAVAQRLPLARTPPRLDSVAAETADLARLRELARKDPGGALALAEEGKRRYGAGLFGQEREAIAVGALSELGRVEEARTRARTFLVRYPGSPLAEKVRRHAELPDD